VVVAKPIDFSKRLQLCALNGKDAINKITYLLYKTLSDCFVALKKKAQPLPLPLKRSACASQLLRKTEIA